MTINGYMKKTVRLSLLFLLGFGYSVAQPRVILDLDIDSDVDDVSALAMLNTMHNNNQLRLLGVIVTSDDSAAAFCASAVNTYFGNGDLPIGILKNQPNLRNHSRYTSKVATEFAHRGVRPGDFPDATELYRELLTNSGDSSVIVLTIGHLTNFQSLLKSRPDNHSKLTGKDLSHKKVYKWICMGGQFPEGKEANFYRPDPASTVYSINEWKKPVVFAGWEVGEKIKTGGEFLKNNIEITSPVYRAYELYNNFKGRSSWDQVAVLLLSQKAEKFFEYISDGKCQVNEDGSNKWLPGKVSNHSYIKLRPGADLIQISQMIDDMVIKTQQ